MATYALTVSTNALGLGVISGATVVVERKRTTVNDIYPTSSLCTKKSATNVSGIAEIQLEADDGTVFHEIKIFDVSGILVYKNTIQMPPQDVALDLLPLEDIISASAYQAVQAKDAAQTSATNAANSAASAATSATNASNSASAASTSATNANNSANAASTSATNAAASATNASNAQTAAEVLLGTTSNIQLLGWAYAQAFAATSVTRNVNNVITTASIVWPDGATGTLTTDIINTTFNTINAWHATHILNGVTKTVTQTAVTRNSSGAVIAQPVLTIS